MVYGRGTALFAGILMCTSAMAAEIYRWVDEQGVTHFSDKPPESTAEVAGFETRQYIPAPGEGEAEDRHSIANQLDRLMRQRPTPDPPERAPLVVEKPVPIPYPVPVYSQPYHGPHAYPHRPRHRGAHPRPSAPRHPQYKHMTPYKNLYRAPDRARSPHPNSALRFQERYRGGYYE